VPRCHSPSRTSSEINLSELDIAGVSPRRAVTKAVIWKNAGRKRGRKKASLLTKRMASVLKDILVTVAVPQRMVDLRITKH
jgi:hypothetical protein